MKNTDLHTHSYYSDGQLSPKKLLEKAKDVGIENIAITDHNTVKGVEESIKYGKQIGINVIPGVELRANTNEILGYFLDYKNPELQKELEKFAYQRTEKIKKRTKVLEEMGIDISYKKILDKYPQAKGNHNTAHVIQIMTADLGYQREETIKIVKKIKEKVPAEKRISLVQAIKLIKKHNGVPVLAHPWLAKDTLQEENFKTYLKAGLAGIELENGDEDRCGRDEQAVNLIKTYAKKHNLILTQGSDYHGEAMIEVTQGHILGAYNCDEKVVEQLKKVV